MEIVPGVHIISGKIVNVFLIQDNGLILIDAGTRNNPKKITRHIQELGNKPDDVKKIIVTHHHWDHTKGLRALAVETGAKVAAHQADRDYIQGTSKFAPRSVSMKIMGALIKTRPAEVDITLKHGDVINGLRVIHTPGHTMGSICLLDKKRGILFAGDALRYNGKEVYNAPEAFSTDPQTYWKSLYRLRDLRYYIMLPSHGKPLIGDASEMVKEFIESPTR